MSTVAVYSVWLRMINMATVRNFGNSDTYSLLGNGTQWENVLVEVTHRVDARIV
jgi:hypothetical protein